MKQLQEKLDFLLKKYSVGRKAIIKNENCVNIDGKDIPLLSHRSERRFVELKNVAHNGTLKGISVMRSANIAVKGSDLSRMLYRELDLCQWILEDPIVSVFAVNNGPTMNVIAHTQGGLVCTVELSATLSQGQKPIDKHEIISQRGIACDKVVDTQIMQNSIYLYGETTQAYTDVDFELYGLEIPEIAVVRQAFAVAKNGNDAELIEADHRLERLVALAEASLVSGQKEVL
ncbi:MAG: hypothetical protein IJY47_06870 [Clostridia bacterium]|nr:hypothetical protein [Clostridia bacterium]